MQKKAYRNTQEKVIAGVCSGLGEYFSIDPLFLRVAFLLLLVEPQYAIIGYCALWIALPKKPIEFPNIDPEKSSNSTESPYIKGMQDFEQKIEEFGEEFEKKAEQFGEEIEKKAREFTENIKQSEGSDTNQKEIKVEINVNAKPSKSKTLAILLISIGAILLAHNFMPDFELERYWPLILIGIGFAILFSGKKEVRS